LQRHEESSPQEKDYVKTALYNRPRPYQQPGAPISGNLLPSSKAQAGSGPSARRV